MFVCLNFSHGGGGGGTLAHWCLHCPERSAGSGGGEVRVRVTGPGLCELRECRDTTEPPPPLSHHGATVPGTRVQQPRPGAGLSTYYSHCL